MRFELFALLAWKRRTAPGDQAWVHLEEVGRLPSWKGKSRHHISTNIGRYLQTVDFSRFVRARSQWAGPYRLASDAFAVDFDLSLPEVRRALQVRTGEEPATERDALLRFARSYARAQWLFFQGKLLRKGNENALADDAYARLLRMTDDRNYRPTLRLLACISGADVLYRLGRFRVAREALVVRKNLVRRSTDLSLKARYYVSLAWAYQRSATSRRSDLAVQAALNRAGGYAENSGDRAALALFAYRRGGYLTKKRRLGEAVDSLLQALESYLITSNYHGVQAACGEIGSVIHRDGRECYKEARRWLISSIGIARLMRLGRDDAHAETILGKIYTELGKQLLSELMLQRAERIASTAGNRVNLGDTMMVWAFWYQRWGTLEQEVATLERAVGLFRSMKEFDVEQKENYMRQRFPDAWAEVLKRLENRTKLVKP